MFLQIVKEYGDVGIYVYLAGCSGEYNFRMGRHFIYLFLKHNLYYIYL